jgi:hypothetical protein
MTSVADMTIDELRQLILDLLEEQRLIGLAGNADMDASEFELDDQPDQRSLAEVFASIERNRWVPPSGSLSPADMLRQDRDEH